MRRTAASLVTALAVALGVAPALGQQHDSEPRQSRPREDARQRPARDPEMRERMLGYFEQRLRTDLELSDDQVSEIVPRVRQMERERIAMTREQITAKLELRRAYRDGATDEELQRLLDRVESVGVRMRTRMQTLMGEMDRSLSVRQRVEFRSFLQRFRREMRDRVEEMRRDSGDRRQRGRPPRQPPGGSPTDPSRPRPP